MKNTRRALISGTAILISVLLTACGGGGGGGGSGGTTMPSGCSALSWGNTSAAPMEPVPINGLSGQFAQAVQDDQTQLYAEARPQGEPEADFLPLPLVVENQGGTTTVNMGAPLNTDDPYSSRTFETTLVAGSVSCDGPSLQVSGISNTATDHISRYIQAMESLLVDEASPYGIASYSDLLQRHQQVINGSQMPPLGLIGALLAVDSLEDLKAHVAGMGTADRTILNDIVAHSGIADAMQQYDQTLGTLGVPSLQTGLPPVRIRPAGTRESISAPYRFREDGRITDLAQSGSSCATLTGTPVSIGKASELSHYMKAQDAAEQALSGYSGASREYVGFISPLGDLVVPGAGTAVGLMVYVESTLRSYSANTLPGHFTAMSIDLSPGRTIPEDNAIAGQTPFWTDALVNAESNGYNLTEPAIDALSQAIGIGRWAGSLTKAGSAVEDVIDTGKSFAQNKLFGWIKNQAGNADCLEVPSHTWRAINVSDPAYTQPSVVGSAFGLATHEYWGQDLTLNEIGTAELAVTTRKQPFGGEQIAANDLVDVVEQLVTWDPAAIMVENRGDTKQVTIEVDRTVRPNVLPTLTASPGVTIVSGPTANGDGTFDVTIGTPSQKDQYPATVTATRQAVLPPTNNGRSSTLELISNRRVTLKPATDCIAPDGSLTMQAETVGFSAGDRVNWSLSGPGSITPASTSGDTRTATYDPGGSEGVADITAAAADDGSINDQARISVGPCDTQMHVYGKLVVSADAQSNDSTYDSDDTGILSQPPSPPTKPASFWNGRTESFVSTESVTGDLFNGGPSASADAHGALDLLADGNGGLTFRHDSDTLSDQCREHPDNDDDTVRCSAGKTATAGIVSYYVDIDAAKTLELTVSGRCERVGDAYGGAFVNSSAFRAVGGDPNDIGGLNGPFANHPNYTSDNGQIPMSVPDLGAGNICASGNPGTFSYSRTLELDGPVVQGQTDVVYLQVGIGTVLGNDPYPQYSITDSLSYSGGGGTPSAPAPSGDPAIGTYSGNGDVEFNVRLEER